MNMLNISYKVANCVMDMVLNILKKSEEEYGKTSIVHKTDATPTKVGC
jgi:hypothetical protein